jgi:hypothetical protein
MRQRLIDAKRWLISLDEPLISLAQPLIERKESRIGMRYPLICRGLQEIFPPEGGAA